MLASIDANFVGYTFKKSDVLKSIGTSGELLFRVLLLLIYSLSLTFSFIFLIHFGLLSKKDIQETMRI